MISKKVTLVNGSGFHMRPAMNFANAMGKFASDINIIYNGNTINGKSVMNIIAGCIKCGTEIELQCSGSDENEAMAEAIKLIESGLGE